MRGLNETEQPMSLKDVRAYIHRSIRLRAQENGLDESAVVMGVLIGPDRWKTILNGAECTSSELVMIAQALGCKLHDLTPFEHHGPLDLETNFARLAKSAALAEGKKRARIFESVRIVADMFDKRSAVIVAIAAGGLLTTSLGWYRAHDVQAETASSYAELLTTLEQSSAASITSGQALSNFGNVSAAEQAFTSAVEAARARLAGVEAGSPQVLDAQFDLAQAVFWLADFHYRRGDTELAAAGYQEYAQIGQSLANAAPDNLTYRAERAWGHHNLAIVDFERGRLDTAAEGFTRARNEFALLIDQEGSGISTLELADTTAWLADTRFNQGRFTDAGTEREAELNLYAQLDSPSLRVELKAVHAIRARAQLALLTDNVSVAESLNEAGLETVTRLLGDNPGNERVARHYASLLSQRASVLIAQDDLIGAKILIDRAPARLFHEIEGDWIPHWRISVGIALSAAKIAAEMGASDTTIREAENALRHLTLTERPYVDTPRLIARAYELLGDGLRRSGNETEAESAWRLGLQALEDGQSYTLEQAIQARLAHKLGETDVMAQARAAIMETEFAHPEDQAYWASVDAANSVEVLPGND